MDYIGFLPNTYSASSKLRKKNEFIKQFQSLDLLLRSGHALCNICIRLSTHFGLQLERSWRVELFHRNFD